MSAWCARVGFLSLACLVLSGCSGAKVTTKTSSQLNRYQVRTIAMVPFETLATPQVVESVGPSFPIPAGGRRTHMSVAVPLPTDQAVERPTHLVPPSAGEKVTELMWRKLKSRSELQFLSPSEAVGAARELAKEGGGEPPSPQKIAQRLTADAALIGKVLLYQERVGSRLGADPPAAVGFEVKLVAPDGLVLWEGNYYEKQRPMTEDFRGFVQRYGMFVTADELAAYGASELAEAFPFGRVD